MMIPTRSSVLLLTLLAFSIIFGPYWSALAQTNKSKSSQEKSRSSLKDPAPAKTKTKVKSKTKKKKTSKRKTKTKRRKATTTPLPASILRHIEKGKYKSLLRAVSRRKSNLGNRRAFLEGYALLQLKRYRQAIKKWKLALSQIPELRPYIFHFTAETALAMEDTETARQALKKLIRLEPSGPLADQAHEKLARIALRQDRPLQAAQWFERLLKRFPNHEKAPTFLAERARALEEGGRNRKAAIAWRRLWSRYPENSEADKALNRAEDLALGLKPPLRSLGARDYFQRARRLQRRFFYKKAQQAYRELKRIFPNSNYQRDIAFQEALTLYSLRETQQAERALEEAIHLFAQDSSVRAKIRYYLSRNHLRNRDQSAFEREIQTLLDESPKSRWAARGRFLMARVQEDDLEYETAERYYQEIIKHHPYSYLTPISRWQLSWIRLQRGTNLDAHKGFRQIALRSPGHRLSPSALYWSGVAAERAGEIEKAVAQYTKGVKQFRHLYYGQLSEKSLRRLAKKRRSIGIKLPPKRFAGYKKWTTPPSGPLLKSAQNRWLAAALLASMGFYEMAAAEYERLGRSPYFSYRAALSYSRGGQHGKAVRILHSRFLNSVQAGGKDLSSQFWKISFPLLAKRKIPGGADPLLVNSIIKAESLFDKNAFSSAGAMGLMQLMPGTGRRVAKKLKMKLSGNEQLFDPAINLRLGAYHLGQLVKEFKGQLVPAIASYNAGSRPVKRWWKNRKKNEPIETFIERIPYQETRNYVKKVLGYLQEYRRLYRKKRRTANRK